MILSAIPIFNREFLFYLREEKQNYFSYRVLKGIGSERTRLMNSMAYKLLTLCDGKKSVADIIRCQQESYPDVSSKRICHDVNFALKNLTLQGLIQWQTPIPWIPSSNFVMSIGPNLLLAHCDEDSVSAVSDFVNQNHVVNYSSVGVGIDPLFCGCEMVAYQDLMVAALRKADNAITALLTFSLGIPEDANLYSSLSISRVIASSADCLPFLALLLQNGLKLIVEALESKVDLDVCRTWVTNTDENVPFTRCLCCAGFSRENRVAIKSVKGECVSYVTRIR